MTFSEKASAITLVLVLAVIGLKVWGRPDQPAIPDSTRMTIDSLDRTAPAFDSAVTTKLADAERDRAEAARLATVRRQGEQRARTERARGDSLALVALAAESLVDSVRGWRAAYDARTAEAVQLRQVVDTLTREVALWHGVADSLRVVAHVALDRLDVTTGVNRQLRDAITKATTCRVGAGVLSLPCLSRRTAFVAGTALGVAGVLAAR